MNTGHSLSVEEQVSELRSRVLRLEQTLHDYRMVFHEAAVQTVAEQAAATQASTPAVAWTDEIARLKAGRMGATPAAH